MKAVKNPGMAFRVVRELFKGYYYKLRYFHKASFGKNFKVDGTLRIVGPGKVNIGNSVRIGMNVDLYTHEKDAKIIIHSNSFLNGTRISAAKEIIIHHNCILAECQIIDTNFHNIDPYNRHEPNEPQSIHIQPNVWITIGVIILPGAQIGKNTTVGCNSVVTGKLKANSLYGGVPAKFIKRISEHD